MKKIPPCHNVSSKKLESSAGEKAFLPEGQRFGVSISRKKKPLGWSRGPLREGKVMYSRQARQEM
jgi:hypothetical protein